MNTKLRERKGSILIYTVALMLILLITAGSFMKWAADEAYQAQLDLARSQAYYIAQLGAIEQGMAYLRTQKLYQLDRPDYLLPDGPTREYGEFSGHYEDALVLQQQDLYGLGDDDFVKTGAWDATAVGVVEVNQNGGTVSEVRSEYTLRSQLRTFANFMYLTNIETAQPPDSSGDDRIWFATGDELWGRVHSNDYIGINGSPIFHGPVSTCMPNFAEGGAGNHAIFDYPPVYNAPEIHFPETAQDIREGAAVQNLFIEDEFGTLLTDMEATPGGWLVKQWTAGDGVVPPEDAVSFPIAYGNNTIVFVDGTLYLHGESVKQRNTIACAGNMYLTDNIMYDGYDLNDPEIDEDLPHILGLVSESNIVIRNTPANGRADGGAAGENAPHGSAHIVITAGLVALGESFTFEHQNDRDQFGEPQPAPWDHGNYLFCTGSDERGLIYLRGAVAQERRGYVHRSNCGGTGYWKNYMYDFRLQLNPPPLYLAAADKDGNVFFEVTNSWASNPNN